MITSSSEESMLVKVRLRAKACLLYRPASARHHCARRFASAAHAFPSWGTSSRHATARKASAA
jgi:hypothetical protein